MLRYVLQFLLFFPLCVFSQEVRVVLPEEVSEDNYFELKYIIENADVDGIELPALSDFTLLSGPNTSRSSSMMINGGKMTQSKSTTYTYILEPKSKGVFTIPSAQLKVDGKKVSARKVTIKVTESQGGQSGTRRYSSSAHQQQQKTIRNVTEKDLYVRAIVSKTKVMEQEALTLTYRVYWKMGVGLSNIYLQKTPDFQGFVTNEIPINTLNVSVETIGGELYKVADRLKYVLIPQKTGMLEVSPLTVDCELVESDPTMDAFDAFFNGRMRSRVIKCNSQKLAVEVVPLPLPKPEDFIGVVGNLEMEGKWGSSKVEAGGTAHYQLTLKGEGNLKLMLSPQFVSNADMDVYDVVTSEELVLTASGHKGKVVYDYPIVPNSIGKLKMPTLTGTYYNLSTGRYEQLKVTPGTLQVLPAIGGTSNEASQEHLQDIHTIYPGLHEVVTTCDYIFWGRVGYWLNYLLVLCGMVSLYFIVKKVGQRDLTAKLQKGALRKALNQLKQAEVLIKSKQNDKFYELISEIITNYLMTKYKLQQSDLNKQNIESLLNSNHVDAAIIQRLLKVIDECEFAKFAPAPDEGGLKELLKETTEVIRGLDSFNK